MSKPSRYDALVLDALWRQSLITVRSLGRRGLRVAALEMADQVPAFASRWCQQSFSAPAYAEGAEAYLSFLEDVLDQTQARVLMPSSDGTIAVIRQRREQLERRVRIPLANEAALDIAINKERTLEIAGQLGLKIPLGVTVATVHEVTSAINEVGLPAVVKPVESWLWGEHYGVRLAGQLVTTPDEARQAVEARTGFGGKVLFQRFLSGRNEAISFMHAHGHIYARFAQWAKRTDPPLGGTSVLRQSIPLPIDAAEQAEQLVREIGLEGYSEVEFRRDANGVAYLMEINPRLSASVEVAVRAGVDFPYLLYQWANGERIDEVKSYSTGLWMRYLRGDFMTTLVAIRERGRPGVKPPAQAIRDFCLSFFMPVHYDYLDWRDPRPAFLATADFYRYVVQRLRRPSDYHGTRKGDPLLSGKQLHMSFPHHLLTSKSTTFR